MNSLDRTRALVSSLAAIHTHLVEHPGVAGPYTITASVDDHGAPVTVQLDGGYGQIARLAGGLLSWADTLHAPSGELWRPGHGWSAHLSVIGTTGDVAVKVWGGTRFDPTIFGDLAADQSRSITLGQLRAWALGSIRGDAA